MKVSNFLLILGVLTFGNVNAQISIINANITEYNISKSALSQITISNLSEEGSVIIESQITNASNEVLLKMKSAPVNLKKGVNVLGAHNLRFEQMTFASSPQGNYLKNMHRLPSGGFQYCITLKPVQGIEEGDEYCQSIDASSEDQMYLVSPSDEDEIYTPTPILLWLHSEPFNLLSQGEFFRLTLVEVHKGQDPAEAITVNVPYFISNYVSKHQVQYPSDAKPLKQGKRYAWMVQKVSNGNILATTEVSMFSVSKEKDKGNHVYVELSNKPTTTTYFPEDERIYFRYNERYNSTELFCSIHSDNRGDEDISIVNLGGLTIGINLFELDLKPYNLKKGFYYLVVENQKNEIYKLKFKVD